MLLGSKKVTLFGKTYKVGLTHLLLLIILAVAAYLRFANFPLKYGFDFDPTRDALIVAEGAKHLRFPLIGPQSGIGPFAFGPWYYYELIVFKLLIPAAFSPWIFIGITSVLTVVVMYFVGKELEGEWFGLLLALLTAFSPEQIGPTTGLSNPNLVPFHAALTVLLFILYVKRKSLSGLWIFVWGLVVGIGINHHYQMLLLLPLPFFALIAKWKKQTLIDACYFIGGLSLPFVPLVVYNIRHHFETVTGFMYFITKGRQGTYIPNRWLFYVRDFWVKFLSMTMGIPQIPTIILTLGTLSVFLWSGIKKQLSNLYLLMILTFVIDFVFLRYFVVQRELYYFLFFHPFLCIFFGYMLWQVKKIRFGFALIIIILLTMFPSVLSQDFLRIMPRNDQIIAHTQATALEHAFPDKKITLFACSKEHLSLNIPQGVAFFLNNDNRLADNGIPVALPTQNCTKEILSQNGIEYSPIPESSGIQLHNPNLSLLKNLHWQPISPAAIFTQTLEQ